MRTRFGAIASSAVVAGILGLTPLGGAAPSYTVRSAVDATRIGVEDQVQLTLSLEGSGGPESVPLPTLTNLAVVGGPFQSTQVSIANGRMSQTLSWTYVLRPQGEGRAEVGQVTAGEQTAPAITIEVVAGSVRPRPARRRDPFGMDPFRTDPFDEIFGRSHGPREEPKVLIEASPSRRTLHVGEPLLLTYLLYTQVVVSDLNFKEAPQYGGFWTEDLERPQTPPSGEPATVGGESYRRIPVLRKLLFPTKAGTLEISAATFRIGLPARGFFDEGRVIERSTRPVRITVEPLPDAPGFSGAVGSFRAEASLDRDAIPFGEAALLRLRLKGTGNLKWIERPPEVEVAGAKVYPPQAKSDLSATPQGIRGSRTWEFVVVPQTSGTLEVPAVAFSYFDPKTEAIVTTKTSALPLRVEGGTSSEGAVAPAVALGGDGLLPLRADLEVAVLTVPSLGGRAVAILAGLALLAHLGLWGVGLLRTACRRVGGRTTPVRSVRSAMRDIKAAARLGMAKEQAAALLDKGLHEAFGDVGDDDESEQARAVRALLEEVHFVRYAPQLGDYSETLRNLARRAADVVRRWA